MTAPSAEESRALLEQCDAMGVLVKIADHLRAALDREAEALDRAENAEARVEEWRKEYRALRKLHGMVKDRAAAAYAERDAARAEADRVRRLALKAFPVVEWVAGEGFGDDEVLLEMADTLGVGDSDAARAALALEPARDGALFPLTGDARINQRCATEGCCGQPAFRFEAGGVGSSYCTGCASKLTGEIDPLATEPVA